MVLNRIKIKFMLPALLSASLLTGCADHLNVSPQEFLDPEVALSSPENIDGVLEGAYAQLGAGYTLFNGEAGALYGTNLLLIPELQASESYLTWQGTFTTYRDVSQKAMLADNSIALVTWRRAYRAINSVNGILGALNLVTDPEAKKRIEGEARFIRGLLYFELVRLYAQPWVAGTANSNPGVPLVLTATGSSIGDEAKVKRNTVAEVYAQVLQDLKAAKEMLPETNNKGLGGYKGRASTYVASAFLSRVYLQQNDYTNAGAEADRVIRSGKYALGGVKDVFDNDRSAEAIFEIQQTIQNNAGTANDGMATFYASGGPGNGRADVRVERAFYNLYADRDLRKQQLYYVGTGRRPGALRSGKWFNPYKNVPVIRLAEMYLTRAEANARMSTSVGATALQDMITIRTRAGLIDAANPAPATVSVEDILLERRLELAYEGHAIHDIKRTKGKTGNFNYDSPKLVFPIPQREIDVNPNLTQNTGY